MVADFTIIAPVDRKYNPFYSNVGRQGFQFAAMGYRSEQPSPETGHTGFCDAIERSVAQKFTLREKH